MPKVQNGKEIEHNRQNVFKSKTKSNNHNCKNFVKLNKRKTLDKLVGKMLDNIGKPGNRGFYFC